MYQEFTLAGEGMRKMFLAQIIAIVSVIVMVIPIIGLIGIVGSLASFILSLMGLHYAGPAHPYFKTAMTVTVVSILVSVVSSIVTAFPGGGMVGSVLDIVTSVLALLVTYYVCHAAAALLTQKGDQAQADKGIQVWKLYLGCMVAGVVCTLLAAVPVLGAVAVGVSLIAGLAQLVAGILYLVFLNRASASLLA